MKFTAVGNNTLHYTLDGPTNGLPLVFIHSLGTELRIWDGVASHFAEDFKIICYDLRGHGLSDCPPAPYSVQDHVADLVGLLTYLNIETAALIGISVGGMVAMAYAAAYPQRIKALVLCDTGTTIGTTSLWNERIAALRQNDMDYLGEAIVGRWFTPAFAEQHAAEYHGYYNMLTRTPVTGYTATCEAIRDADFRDVMRSVKAKTLVLCGSEDQATPPAQGRALAETLADARFALIENAAHLPCIEQCNAVSSLIKWFLQEQGYGR